ncbi:MAG: RQC domain-containing protein, partial [Bacteroidota bacterium]
CLMFYSYNDIIKLEKFNKDKAVTERENAKFLLEEIASYAESTVCRRKQLLHYFGEEYKVSEEACRGMCDNCKFSREQFDGQEIIEIVIHAVTQTDERFDVNHLAALIIGKSTQHIKSYGHDKLDVFGKGEKIESDETFWKSAIRQTLLHELLIKDIEVPGVFKVSEKGKNFIADPYKIKISRDHDYAVEGEEEESEKTSIDTKSYDTKLFEVLKALRKIVAKQKGLPPYVIFQDPSLEEMATLYPTTNEELIKIVGVGESKARKFGKPFLDEIIQYIEDNDIITPGDILVKSAGIKSKNKIGIIMQIDRQTDLEEIAESKGMKYEELIVEIETISNAGTKLNLDYYIDQLLDDDRQDDIYDYFLSAETDSVAEAVKELGEDYSEDEIRLMRIKFMSEYAH